jgi:hypothetical protein
VLIGQGVLNRQTLEKRPFPSEASTAYTTLPCANALACEPTGSGRRRQMATPSRSIMTIRWVDSNFLLNKYFSASSCHLQVTSAFTSREKRSQAGINGRWRHVAEVTGPFDRPTPLCYWCSVSISRPAATVLELIALFEVVTTEWKRQPPLGDTAWRE